jgi:hypothetical protein
MFFFDPDDLPPWWVMLIACAYVYLTVVVFHLPLWMIFFVIPGLLLLLLKLLSDY